MKATSLGLILLVFTTVIAAGPALFAQPPQGDDPSPVIVNVMDVHLCCKQCVKAVEKAASVDDVQVQVTQDERLVVLTAPNYKAVQAALDEIAKAGFSGKIEDDTQAGNVSFPEIRTPDKNVKKLTVTHIHNCCRSCADAIATAVESVPGVESHTIKPKQEEFVVEGDFDPGAVVDAICDAGFYPQVR